jgi:two-component system sensor histidine kinase KdpD
VVALAGGPEGQMLIRRAARMAARSSGDLLAVHITRPGVPAVAVAGALAAQRQLTESIGGTYHQLTDRDIPAALLIFARAENATQLILGTRHRSRLSALRPQTRITSRITSRVIHGSSGTDVHIITHTAHRVPRQHAGPADAGPARPGLLGLKDRVAAIGGTFRLHSPPNAGPWLRVELPLGDRSQ